MRRYAALVRRLAHVGAWEGKQLQHQDARYAAAVTFTAAGAAAAARASAWTTPCVRRAYSFAAAAPLARGFAQLRYLLGLGGVVVAAQFDDVTDTVKLGALAAVRLGRDVATAAAIVADYKTSLAAAPPPGPARQEVLSACHQRGAERLLALCFKNGGIYTKLGQHIGQLDHLLPSEYVDTMRANLLDRCPVSDYEEVSAIIKEDLGAAPEQLFVSFERQPIASASLAQARPATTRTTRLSPLSHPTHAWVHVAVGKDGSKLAVKVQHAGLRESCAADIHTIEMLVRAARVMFPDFNYQWLVEEVKENLPRELDFLHEASNAERCRANFASPKSRLAGRVHIPELYPALSSSRVLTMEYIDGARVTDGAALDRLGVSRPALAALVAEAFNEMVFIHGDVHCDPHAANMLVRKVGGRQQLVLLDHGLYRVIDDEFRARYAALWRALVFADAAGIKEHAAAMNAGELYPLFAAMLTQRPWEQIVDRRIDHLALPKTSADKQMLQGYAQVYLREIGDLLLRMPRPLLLLLKTNDCLRSVDHALGSQLNTVVMTARECTRALSDIRSEREPGVRSWLMGAWDAAHVEVIVAALRMASLWASLRRSLMSSGPSRGRSGGASGGKEGEADGEGALPPLQQLPAEFVAATSGAAGAGAGVAQAA